MAFEPGTAANYADLLAKLRTFLTATLPVAQRWTELDWEPTPAERTAAAASSSDTGIIPGNALGGAGWRTAVNALSNQWLSITHSQPVYISSFTLAMNSSYRLPANFRLEWSDNGTDWTTQASYGPYVQADWSNSGYTRTFTTGATAANKHLHWRLFIVDALATGANNFFVTQLTPYEGWVDLRDQKNTRRARLALRGPGAGADQIFVNIATHQDSSGDYYNWHLNGASGFTTEKMPWQQPGALTDDTTTTRAPALLLWNAAIPYWFAATGRRFMVVAKINTTYHACYAGFLLPYATPAQYPYPLVIGGSAGDKTLRWSATTTLVRNFYDPGGDSSQAQHASLRLRSPGGEWLSFANFSGTESISVHRNVGPYVGAGLAPDGQGVWARVRDCPDGSYALFPCVLNTQADVPGKAIYGELDGVYAISGFNNAAENLALWGGVNHLVIPNVYRGAKHQWAAMRLE